MSTQSKLSTEDIILSVHELAKKAIQDGNGPFVAVVYDKDNNLIAQEANSVVKDQSAINYAEVNAVKATSAKLKTYDLAPYDLSIYTNAEPNVLGIGAIMWSGIKHVYYSLSTEEVESITGFKSGFKPENWHEEFQNRGISVQGGIKIEEGKAVFEEYIKTGKKIYNPSR